MPRPPLIASFLLAVLVPVALGIGLIRASSATYDEPVHLAAGYADLKEGRYRLNALDHPPLAEMWAALPLLALKPSLFSTHPDFLGGRVYHYGDLFLYHNRVAADRLLNAARTWNLLTLTLLLAAALVAWAARLEGAPAAAAAAFALAFCPAWSSNAALVTTDGLSAALFFAAFALLAPPGPRPSARWAWAGAAAGAALAAKFNMILLPPLLACAAFGEARLEKARTTPASRALLAAGCAALALAAAYRFGWAGLWFDGLSATLSRLAEGRPSYLAGRHGSAGWWWYFPLALLVKTPVPLLLLGVGGAVLAARRPRGEALWLLLPPAGYFLASLATKTQIGLRHVLPLYPFLCLWAGLAGARLWRAGTPGRAALGLLLAWQAASVLRAHPHHLAYFNEAAGGPAAGGRWLADSNLDWGQDLPGLAKELAARGNPVVLLSYFGTADPAAHGLRYVPVGMHGNVERAGNASLAKGAPVLFAVSETNRAGVYFREHDAFAWLASRTPVARPGWSIALYDLSADADARARVAAWLAGAGRAADAAAVHPP